MYARIITVRVAPERLDEAIQLWHAAVAPSVRQQPGFRNARFFVERATGRITSMGLWATEADLLASVAWNLGRLDQFARLFVAPPSVGHYELAGEAFPPD
jgi:hypothetical protein